MGEVVRENLYDCPKCKALKSVVYKVEAKGNFMEISISDCNSCGKEVDAIELFDL